FKLSIPNQALLESQHIAVQSQFAQGQSDSASVDLPYLTAKVGQPQIQILPITSDNQLSAEELKQSVVVKGQVSGLNASQLSTDQPIVFKL
ncbi:MFS transporter, partial [Acinetobacter guillouiae]